MKAFFRGVLCSLRIHTECVHEEDLSGRGLVNPWMRGGVFSSRKISRLKLTESYTIYNSEISSRRFLRYATGYRIRANKAVAIWVNSVAMRISTGRGVIEGFPQWEACHNLLFVITLWDMKISVETLLRALQLSKVNCAQEGNWNGKGRKADQWYNRWTGLRLCAGWQDNTHHPDGAWWKWCDVLVYRGQGQEIFSSAKDHALPVFVCLAFDDLFAKEVIISS